MNRQTPLDATQVAEGEATNKSSMKAPIKMKQNVSQLARHGSTKHQSRRVWKGL